MEAEALLAMQQECTRNKDTWKLTPRTCSILLPLVFYCIFFAIAWNNSKGANIYDQSSLIIIISVKIFCALV